MTQGSPATTRAVLRNARLRTNETVDIVIEDGHIADLRPSTDAPEGSVATREYDLEHRLVVPGLVESHAHLDKALSADSVDNPTGDLAGAVTAWMSEREARPVSDFAERADAALERLVRHGVSAVRTHVDVGAGVGLKGVEALLDVQARWADRVHVELVGLAFPLGDPSDTSVRELLQEAMSMGVDLVGGVPAFEADPAAAIAWCLDLAAQFDAGVDLHVDESLDPAEQTIVELARQVTERGCTHITASHVVSLSMQSLEHQQRTADAIAAAGITIITLPQTNLYLQARNIATAPPRGLTPIDVLRQGGVQVVAGGDNLEDPFNPMGRGDPLETASLLVTAGHQTPDTALNMVLSKPQLKQGDPAHLAAFEATSVRELVARAPASRMNFFHGKLVAHTSNISHDVGS